ncbi:expansin-A25-like [Phragmites australis]|uniref:expansin-A25-like n=1 Tax=Phragmites australis TaxID=29695 RepID=UPI002D7738C3|nr:expansin-A25-like [Phragmites australis]
MDTSASSSQVAAAAVAVAMALLVPILSAAAGGDGWEDAHATFYGDETGGETMQGACGYGDLFQQGYGLETTALSVALFNEGWSCGGCYELLCHDSTYCAPGGATVRVTATNLCPANYSKPNENWCNPPLRHFDLSKPMFLRLVTDFRAGIIPVTYRRVPCAKRGGIRFEMKGNQWWVGVLVFNVAGAGDVKAMAVKGSQDGQWADMSRNWGQIWNGDKRHVGQGLSFRVVASDGRALVLDDVVPPAWAFGQSFEASGQF